MVEIREMGRVTHSKARAVKSMIQRGNLLSGTEEYLDTNPCETAEPGSIRTRGASAWTDIFRARQTTRDSERMP